MLLEALVFLLAALVVVPLSRRLGQSSVLGYLAAGLAIGPYGLGLGGDASATLHFAEIGVVFLLFVIGLEMQPRRLWVMRKLVFGLGSLQIVVTALVLAAALWLWLPNDALLQALVIGGVLSMSSTAFVLQLLAERKELNSHHGRAAFGVLLLQDLAVIPAIALVDWLAGSASGSAIDPWLTAAIVVAIVAARYSMRPVLRAIASTGTPELFTAAALALVIGAALATQAAGLSMGLGAFAAGMLVADSEYRHQLEADVEPFKGLLLGLFFMAVGMTVDLSLLLREPLILLALTAALMALKAATLWPLARAVGMDNASALRTGVILSQGGEFAFVLLMAVVTAQLVPAAEAQRWLLVVTLSMVATPFAVALLERLQRRRTPQHEMAELHVDARPVLLLGFGRVAQIVARVLTMRRIPFTALENDVGQLDFMRSFGNEVHYADPTRFETLRAARVADARAVVLAIDDAAAALRVAELLRANYPWVPIFARARNRFGELRLREMGAHYVVRETLHSSLAMSEALLQGLGVSAADARASIAMFQSHDAETMERQLAVFHDETAYRQTAREAAIELQQLFDEDALAQRALLREELRELPSNIAPPAAQPPSPT